MPPNPSRPSRSRSLRPSRFPELAHPGRPPATQQRRRRKCRRIGPRSQSGRRSGTAVRHRQTPRGPIARRGDGNEAAPQLTALRPRSGASPPLPRARADSHRRVAPTPHRWSTQGRLTHTRLTRRRFLDAPSPATLRRAPDRSCPAGYRPRRRPPTHRAQPRRRPARVPHPMAARRFRSGWRRRRQRRPQTRRPCRGHRQAQHHRPCPSAAQPRHRRRQYRRRQNRPRQQARRLQARRQQPRRQPQVGQRPPGRPRRERRRGQR
jgi:hypothetical protein